MSFKTELPISIKARSNGGGGTTRLTSKEVSLLTYLAERSGETVTREALLEDVWGYSRRVTTRTVDITVRRLRMKIESDPAEPQHIITVHGVGYVFHAPKPAPSTQRGKFPVDPSSFVGRKEQFAKLTELFNSGRRVVTICGPGGHGKTRIARVFATSHLKAIQTDEAVFIDLTACRDRTDMLVATAGAFGGQVKPGASTRDLERQLQSVVRASGAILAVFDNFEQVVDVAADALAKLLEAAPKLRVLVTSRESLRIQGEKVLTLAPLSVAEAVQLFFERREDADIGEEPVADMDQVAVIVERIDRNPLAIELAAARMSELSLEELKEKLDHRFELLRFGRRDAPTRHQTLWATIDWSWQSLSDAERATLAQCSVFTGSFDREAATEVVQLDSPTLEVEQQLWALQRKSLLGCRMIEGGRRRFSLLVSIREYARAKLEESGAVSAADRRAAGYYCALVERCGTRVAKSTGANTLLRLNVDVDNVLASQRRISAEDPAMAARLGLGIQPLLSVWAPCDLQLPTLDLAVESARQARPSLLVKTLLMRVRAYRSLGREDEAVADFEELSAIRLDGSDSLLELEIKHMRGLLCCDHGGHVEGRRVLAEVVAEAQAADGATIEADALVDWARIEGRFGDSAFAQGLLDRALDIYQRLDHHRGEGITHDVIGWSCIELGQLDRAERHLNAALEIHRDRQDARLEAEALHSLAYLAIERGTRDKARALLEQALVLKQRVGDRVMEAHAHGSLGLVALEDRELEQARSLFERCSESAREAGDRRREACMMACAGAVEAIDGNDEGARQLLARATTLLMQHAGGWGLDIVAAFRVLTDYCVSFSNPKLRLERARRAREFLKEEGLKSGTSLLHRAALRVLATELKTGVTLDDTLRS